MSVHELFKGMPGFPAASRLIWTDKIPSDFHSQPDVVGDPVPGPGALGWAVRCGTAIPPDSSLPHVGVEPVSCLCPSYQTQSGFFFISLVTEFLFS